MNIDDAKENIQPLAQGRNASILQASLKVESSQELLIQRKELEEEIRNYSGDDPLSVWYNYIEWIEQSFPSAGKESGLKEVLSKCLTKFESYARYNQDRRMIKLYIKFIDSLKDPAECYQQLFNAGVGTMVADFYIAWAYCYDLIGNTRKADEVFRRGISCRAQPLEELQEAHQHFGFSVAQRLMYKDDDYVKEEANRQLHERRLALTSLRGHRRKQIVGSRRTGSAIKSVMPGTIKVDQSSTSQRSNEKLQVFNDENGSNVIITQPINSTMPSTSEEGKSAVRSIIDAARNQENEKEPGPWNKAHNRKKGKLFGKSTINNDLGFEIHEDDDTEITSDNVKKLCIPPIFIEDNEIKFDKPFIYPENFCGKSEPIRGWFTPVTTEEMPDKNTIPQFNKCKLYPRPNMEFQPEELKAYYILKKRGIENKFTKDRDVYWGCGPDYNIRLYPHFAKQSKPQKMDVSDEIYIPDILLGLKVAFNEIYNKEDKVERQFEEISALRLKRNETIIKATDMEETMCTTSEKVYRRKSFFPMRKSLAPSTFEVSNNMSVMPEQCGMNELVEASVLLASTSIKNCNENNAPGELLMTQPKPFNDISVVPQSLLFEDENTLKNVKLISQQKTVVNIEANQNIEEHNSKENSLKTVVKFKDEDVMELGGNIPLTMKSNVILENDFPFKTPALPNISPAFTSASGVANKIQFEIFEDENVVKNSSNSNPKPDFSCGTGGFFDPEETCSTQTFNKFLKAQSVSTPKAITKCQSQRQFGNVLKEIGPTILEQKDQFTLVTDNQTSTTTTTAAYSPARQQLSTILETSEHGTTQGTHTTGATTKSTLSSPEIDLEYQVQITTTITNQLQPTLETVKELSCESSFVTSSRSSVQNVEKLMCNMDKENVSVTNKSKLQQENLVTPEIFRFQKTVGTGAGLDFSIFEDTSERSLKQVGNFSRLEEKEDTTTGSAIKIVPAVRFQDDKTETITKIHMTSQQVKFQDDKTETISNILFVPPQPVQFQEDKTEAMSKLLLGPPQSIKFPDDKTETLSKFMLAPPQLVKFEDGKTDIYDEKKGISQLETMNKDDSFEFFGHTPPKATKQLTTKHIDKSPLSQIRTTAYTDIPLLLDTKGFCDKDTLDLQKSKPKANILFGDEADLHIKSFNKGEAYKIHSHSKDVLKNSFVPNFSLIEDSQLMQQQSKAVNIKSKSVFRDSFIPDFSIIEDSKDTTKRIENKTKPINDPFTPGFSLIENKQSNHAKTTYVNQQNESVFVDISHAPNRQFDDSIIKSSEPTAPTILKQNAMKSTMHLYQNFSKMNITGNKIADNIHWEKMTNSNAISNTTQEGTALKNILMDTFMKDFSEINEPPHISKEIKMITMVPPRCTESIKKESKNENLNVKSFKNVSAAVKFSPSLKKEPKLSFLAQALPEGEPIDKGKKHSSVSDDDKYFELNCETEMFGANISMIKNSTWLPNHGPTQVSESKHLSEIQIPLQIEENSLHIKHEEISSNSSSPSILKDQQQIYEYENSLKLKSGLIKKSLCNNDISIEISASELNAIKRKTLPTNTIVISESPIQEDDCQMSIYYKHTPKTPKPQVHVWDDADTIKSPARNYYVRTEPDLNQTHQIIENMCIDPNVNPFNIDLINAFLEQHYVISYLESLPTCKLVGCIQRLKPHDTININGITFEVLKLIGEGAYGAVFCGKETSSGKLIAMKQEKPPNYWEYYICLEIQERIRIDEMLPAYMSIDHALIGNNSSILISSFSQYGSLITVCNKIKKNTMKNVDEYVVMLMASELLEIMDHLHAVNIIHADIKADNFLLMKKLTYPPTERHLQLIDFGVSVDMKLFKQGQTFNFIHSENAFKCPEMREQRPWTYQLDLYGLAGVLHVLLFGKYMDIEKKARGFWMHKTHVPRYFNKNLWDDIFKTLLNIRDCNSMPNLQDLRAMLKKEIEEKEKYVIRMVNEFNRALTN